MSDFDQATSPACPNCGTPTAPNAAFCRHCGASLGSAPPPATAPATPPATDQNLVWGLVDSSGNAVAPQNGYSVAALVLGILGLSSLLCGPGVIMSILAIVFGVIGRKKAADGVSTNGGLATAGLIMGVIGTVGMAIVLVLAYVMPD